ncbi:DUF885 domain-containing protein [Pseudoalteromonas denitrificans]|uniref:Uncharacterized conserved protein, DUF885 familyt n=1 Tax=Pseudoalteromonas denitrificans DSM 6059 TaxID=1123010 RepID=A0A1I1S436_9GAMM|nr:DUF885 domain-containing protein [Pseudoalteromonas denitrificans]SFD37720.1 Uncharacterized conserved protein, DUF885 familyt [Pseudoalteromonas denitrificans DSM 6059]
MIKKIHPFMIMLCFLLQLNSMSVLSNDAVLKSKGGNTDSEKLIKLTDKYLEETLPRSPLNAMFYGDNRFNHLWPNDLAPDFISQSKAIEKKYLTALNTLGELKLTEQDEYTYLIFKEKLQNNIASYQYHSEYLPLNQFIFSPHNMFIQLGAGLSGQPFNTVQDFDNFIQRMQGFSIWMEQATVNMRKGIKAGIVLPTSVVESMIPQMQAQTFKNPMHSSLFAPLNNIDNKIPKREKTRLIAEYKKMIHNQITPAFKRMNSFLQQEYLPHTRKTYGYGALPKGKKWYQHAIMTNTSLPLSAQAIHNTGLTEVKRIHQEMKKVAREVGFKGSLKAFFNHLKTDEQFYYKSPNQVLEAYEEVKRRITPKVNDFFSVVPKSDYILRSYPEAQAKSAPGASYIPASSDGTRPGVFFANTYNLKGQPKYGIESLSIHEAVPGHHFQLSLQNEVKGLPKIRTQNFYTVYAEGWALYAESLGKELGMFSDPYQYYGKLDAELFRAMRLVVDTGIHDKGWTQQQAIDYMFNNSTLAKTDIIAEVERYMVWPGQALAYKVGQLKIQSLRLFAEQSLGSKFNIKQFHNLILLDGPLPMPLLEKKIKDWVKHISDLKVEV